MRPVTWFCARAAIPLLAALAPPTLVATAVARYGLNVPLMDQWVFGAQVVEVFTGRFQASELWAPNNEHRVVIPRLVMLALARLTAWDVRYELALNVLLAAGVLALLATLIVRTVWPLAPGLAPWLVLVASLFTFSLSQWQNWTWGWQMAVFMNVLAATATAWALARWGARWPGVLVAILAAVTGTFCFGSGLLLLVLVPLGLLLAPAREPGGGGVLPAVVAAAVGAGVATVYLAGMGPTPGQPAPINPLSAPGSYAYYVLGYVGASLGSPDLAVAARWGAAGITTCSVCAAWLWRRSPAHRAALVPWLLLSLYALLSGCITGVGRLGAGLGTALLSRYITISSLFWTSLAVVVALALAEVSARTRSTPARRAMIALALVAIALAARDYRRSWAYGAVATRNRYEAARRGAECLRDLEGAPDACLRTICWDANILRLFARPLRRYHLGPFAAIAPEPLSRALLAASDYVRLSGQRLCPPPGWS